MSLPSISSTPAVSQQLPPDGGYSDPSLPPTIDASRDGVDFPGAYTQGVDANGNVIYSRTLANGEGVQVSQELGNPVDVPQVGSMPAMTLLSSTSIVVQTTGADDRVRISDGPGDSINITVNGQTTNVANAKGQSIIVRSAGGDDSVSVDVSDERSVTVDAGEGNDKVDVDTRGGFAVTGGAGDDTITASGGGENIDPETGGVSWTPADGINDSLADGGDGNDTITTRGAGIDVKGGAGDDRLDATGAELRVDGGEGNDGIVLRGYDAIVASNGQRHDVVEHNEVTGGDGIDLIEVKSGDATADVHQNPIGIFSGDFDILTVDDKADVTTK